MDEDEWEAAAFWEHQNTLPLHKRDGLWWIEVALSTLVVAGICAAIGWYALGALGF